MDTHGGGHGGIATIAYCPAIGRVITDPRTGTKYILEKVIETSNFNFVYKACYYKLGDAASGNLLPTDYATVKYLRLGQKVIRSKRAEESIRISNIIHVEKWFIHQFREGFCVALPHISEEWLRYILSSRFHYGLPEDCIAIALKQALLSLFDLHNLGRVYKCFSAGNVYVLSNQALF